LFQGRDISSSASTPIMPRVEPRTVLILRRMKRRSFGMWTWSGFNPRKARPEELRFDILDGNQKPLGQLVCTKFDMRFPSVKFRASTPWGEGRVEYTKDGPRMFMNDRELALLKSYMFKGRADFVFPDGTIMRFEKVRGKRNDIAYTSADGRVGFFEEGGTLPDGARIGPIPMTRDEIKALPKEDRPHSVETNDYVQYKIEVAGTLPVKEEDISRALVIFASLGRLMDEFTGV